MSTKNLHFSFGCARTKKRPFAIDTIGSYILSEIDINDWSKYDLSADDSKIGS
jgi:hypothetical protein